jgi:hypothetical protein
MTETSHQVVDLSPLVMAIWSLWAIKDIPDRLREERRVKLDT